MNNCFKIKTYNKIFYLKIRAINERLRPPRILQRVQ
jgi:hypothetical protein